jgi:uncharacterized protein
MATLAPIAPGLWTDEDEPQLIGGQHKENGRFVFPMPDGDAANAYDAVQLAREGTLWSWTVQGFEPKAPYAGATPFAPYGVGYVELAGQVIVETRLTVTTGLTIGMPMRLVIEPFGDRATFAFAPAGEPA